MKTPSKRRFGNTDEDVCSVCLNEMNEEQQLTTTPCNHKFHKSCLEQWKRIRPTCPLCVTSLIPGVPVRPIIHNTDDTGAPLTDPRDYDIGDEETGEDGGRWVVRQRPGRGGVYWRPVTTVSGTVQRNLANNYFGKKNLKLSLKQINKMEKYLKSI